MTDIDNLIQRLRTDAVEAVDGLDDYARMDCGVDAIGPRSVLEKILPEAATALELQSADVARLKSELERKDAALDLAKDQSFELSGVIIDTEQGHGFDDVCLQTVKRVQSILSYLSPSLEKSQCFETENERLKAELEEMQNQIGLLRGIINLVQNIPNMSDEQLAELRSNCNMVIATSKQGNHNT